MQVVIDSESMQALTRQPKLSGKSKLSKPRYETSLDRPMSLGRIVVVLDSPGGILSEWIRTCDPEFIKVLVTRWEELRGILFMRNPPSLDHAVSGRLRRLGFGNDTIDKLILRLAVITKDQVVVSDDSDFWDPTKPKNDPRVKGNRNSPVARLCREELGVTILLLKMLMDGLN